MVIYPLRSETSRCFIASDSSFFDHMGFLAVPENVRDATANCGGELAEPQIQIFAPVDLRNLGET